MPEYTEAKDRLLMALARDFAEWPNERPVGVAARAVLAEGEAKPWRCPRCDSPEPKLHPAMQFEGEVQPCTHPFHTTPEPKGRTAEEWLRLLGDRNGYHAELNAALIALKRDREARERAIAWLRRCIDTMTPGHLEAHAQAIAILEGRE